MIDAMMMDDGDDGRDDEDTITMIVILEAHDSSSATAAGADAKSGRAPGAKSGAPLRSPRGAGAAVAADLFTVTLPRSIVCGGQHPILPAPAQIADVDASRVRETDGAILERLELRGLLVDVCVRPQVFLHRTQIGNDLLHVGFGVRRGPQTHFRLRRPPVSQILLGSDARRTQQRAPRTREKRPPDRAAAARRAGTAARGTPARRARGTWRRPAHRGPGRGAARAAYADPATQRNGRVRGKSGQKGHVAPWHHTAGTQWQHPQNCRRAPRGRGPATQRPQSRHAQGRKPAARRAAR